MLIKNTPEPLNAGRHRITKAYRMDEDSCINHLIQAATVDPAALSHIELNAIKLVEATRKNSKKSGKINELLHKYDLSTEEGIALMCLAEALLRIPDTATMDRFISDKLSSAHWKNHLSRHESFFMNATTWSLLLTGTVYAPNKSHDTSLSQSLLKAASRVGAAVIRPIILLMMKTIGNQFVMGETISAALTRAKAVEEMGYQFSYDMLGEAARTQKDADFYYDSYVNAIDAIGAAAHHQTPAKNPGISVKLSALHPRYEFAKHDLIVSELTPKLLALAKQAKKYNIGFTVDAEEADRLDLSLDIIEAVFKDKSLDGWEGFGLAVQAYQKRAFYVLDWLIELTTANKKRMMVRLVKGAYWDAEIKQSQVMGFNDYPVFTRKNATDVSYLACAKKLLSHRDLFYSQFGTHNCYTVAAILEMAGDNPDFEFQCLHGMGRPLYDNVVSAETFNRQARIYAPVGTHKDLLGYLVRRLLENGANSSFVNRLADESIPMEKIVFDPIALMANLQNKRHPNIPLPKNIYGDRLNSDGLDLTNQDTLAQFKAAMEKADATTWHAGSIVNGKVCLDGTKQSVISPADLNRVVGEVHAATEAQIEEALATAKKAENSWGRMTVSNRADIIERAATLFQENIATLATLLTREAGKSVPDCLSEIREAIDFCHYYALRAREDLKPLDLVSPTGESNQLTLHPRGVMVCISPWNFPLAIFAGQVMAALVAGNPVIAKPAEQTPLIAFKTVQLLHEAGVPKEALQLLIGKGSVVGSKVVADTRIVGVMFTGSTDTAKLIERTLANRTGQIGCLIAETGGQNAMIVDSSALPEQAALDIVTSAFNSAGQRCSALRVLFVQEELAERLTELLKGYMKEITLGDPSLLFTDIGPVIDRASQNMLKEHYEKMKNTGKLLGEVPMPSGLNGHFFAPAMFEISDINVLTGEVFGPILHVVKFGANELEKVMDAIIKTGFGLTLGVHSRIDSTTQYIAERMPVGNIYINRNMVGAVVGVQPFGGERLSGTGPKAGGPHYLPRLCVERTVSINTVAVGGNARLVSLREE